MELLFTEKGYRSIYKTPDGIVSSDESVGLFYLGIPILERFSFSKFSLDLGVHPSYLLGNRFRFNQQSQTTVLGSLFDKVNMSLITGLNYHIKRFTISTRYDYSILPFVDFSYTDENGNDLGTEKWFSNTLSLALSFQINKSN